MSPLGRLSVKMITPSHDQIEIPSSTAQWVGPIEFFQRLIPEPLITEVHKPITWAAVASVKINNCTCPNIFFRPQNLAVRFSASSFHAEIGLVVLVQFWEIDVLGIGPWAEPKILALIGLTSPWTTEVGHLFLSNVFKVRFDFVKTASPVSLGGLLPKIGMQILFAWDLIIRIKFCGHKWLNFLHKEPSVVIQNDIFNRRAEIIVEVIFRTVFETGKRMFQERPVQPLDVRRFLIQFAPFALKFSLPINRLVIFHFRVESF
jgi:hypothetical protein